MKNANLFVVGGPISVGKSSLVEALPFPQVPELDEDNKLQMILLKKTYEKTRVAPEVIEQYFLLDRSKKYKKYSNTLNTYVLDRSIFESLWFSKNNMPDRSYKYFEKLWESEIHSLMEKYGKPKIYILLTCSWDVFKERIFKRGREEEIANFSLNEEFFKRHIKEYEEHMKDVFKRFNLRYEVINTDNLSKEEVLKETNLILKKVLYE